MKFLRFPHLVVVPLVVLAIAAPGPATEAIAPEREISLELSEAGTPPWRVIWDRAREMVRQDNLAEASRLYGQLFEIKDNIEEANWEYCKVLLKTGDSATAARILIVLLEKNPNRNDYLIAAGRIAEENGDPARAVRYFGRVLEKDPAGPDAEAALDGLVRGLRSQGKQALALPLLEGMVQRRPDDRALVLTLALDSRDYGRPDRARQLFAWLLDSAEVDDRLLFQAAELFDVPGHEPRRRALWQEYLLRHPDYHPFRLRLAEDFREQGEFEAALTQFELLAEALPDNRSFLLSAGEISQHDLHRPDKALIFYERVRRNHPEDGEVVQRIEDLQVSLAGDLVSIVENGGAVQLWRDLADIAPNRLAIFLEIADLLDEQGRNRELLETLTILHDHYPADDAITLRIARKHAQIGEHDYALQYLERAGKGVRDKDYFLLKAGSELALGLEISSLRSSQQALALTPGDAQLRRTCIELAGSLGLMEIAEKLFRQGVASTSGQDSEALFFTYLGQLSRNALFSRYAEVNSTARSTFAGDPQLVARLELHRAETLRRQGDRRGAEQLLRTLLHHGTRVEEVLFQLADSALDDRNFATAAIWLQALAERSGAGGSTLSAGQTAVVLLRAKSERLAGNPAVALQQLPTTNPLALRQAVPPVMANRLIKELCRLHYHTGDYQAAWESCLLVPGQQGFDPEVVQLRRLIAEKTARPPADQQQLQTAAGTPIISRQLAMAEVEIAQLDFPAAEQRLRLVLQAVPQSVAATVALGELFLARGEFADAAVTLQGLQHSFPQERAFFQKQLEIALRQGRYDHGLAMLRESTGEDAAEAVAARLVASEDTEALLVYARLLWGARQQQEALQVYQRLLTPSAIDRLRSDFEEKQLSSRALQKENLFWSSLAFLLQSQPDAVTEMMEPSYLLSNLGSEAGKIVSDHFASYSRQRSISNEFQARKAISERHYYYAEKSYQKLLADEAVTEETMSDLATIYSRIGKYRKEAQVYEAMQSSGTVPPELVDSVERSRLQLSPQNILDGGYQRKEGRSGLVDLIKTTGGTSFWVTPDFEKDFHFKYANTRYRSIDTDETAGSNLVGALATVDFFRDYEVSVAGSAEKFNGQGDTMFAYETMVRGKVDDFSSAYVLLGREMVEDSVETVKEQISYDLVKAGIDVETAIGVSFGGDIAHREYSDGNSQNRFHGFSTYTLFGQAMRLALRYDFDYFISSDAYTAAAEEQQEETARVRYWSPTDFTEHRLGVDFRHDFLGYRSDRKTGISSYTINNSVGLEDNETITYTGMFNFFLEISPHLLVKGDLTFSTSEQYEEKSFALSLHYRW